MGKMLWESNSSDNNEAAAAEKEIPFHHLCKIHISTSPPFISRWLKRHLYDTIKVSAGIREKKRGNPNFMSLYEKFEGEG